MNKNDDLISPDLTQISRDFNLNGVVFEDNRLNIGTGVFERKGASFADQIGPLADQIVPARHAVLCETSATRFLKITNALDEKPFPIFDTLKIPTVLFSTSDDRNSCYVSAAGGLREAKTFEANNRKDASMPVILFVVNNGTLVEADDFDDELQAKVNKGLYPRFEDGNIRSYVTGKSFSQFYPPARLSSRLGARF